MAWAWPSARLLYTRGSVTIGTAFLIVSYIGMLAAPLEEIRDQARELRTGDRGRRPASRELFRIRPQVADTAARRDLPARSVGSSLRATYRLPMRCRRAFSLKRSCRR